MIINGLLFFFAFKNDLKEFICFKNLFYLSTCIYLRRCFGKTRYRVAPFYRFSCPTFDLEGATVYGVLSKCGNSALKL